MATERYEQRLNAIYVELKKAHENRDELLAFDLVAEINRLKSLMVASVQS